MRTIKEIKHEIRLTKQSMKLAGIKRTSFMNAGLGTATARYNFRIFELETELKNVERGFSTPYFRQEISE